MAFLMKRLIVSYGIMVFFCSFFIGTGRASSYFSCGHVLTCKSYLRCGFSLYCCCWSRQPEPHGVNKGFRIAGYPRVFLRPCSQQGCQNRARYACFRTAMLLFSHRLTYLCNKSALYDCQNPDHNRCPGSFFGNIAYGWGWRWSVIASRAHCLGWEKGWQKKHQSWPLSSRWLFVCFGPGKRMEMAFQGECHLIDWWMDGWMDGWINGLIDGWMDGWMVVN